MIENKSLSPVFHFKDVLRLLYPVRVLAVGLLVSQAIGTVLVYFSNLALAEKIAAIQASGYGPLPGVNIDPSLSSLEAAFAGGLFFTLSIGAGVTLLTFGAVLLFSALPSFFRVYKTAVLNRGLRIIALALLLPAALAALALAAGWPAALVWGNARGACYGLSAFLLLVPPPVILAALKWSPRRTGQPRLPWRNPVHFALIAALLALWTARFNPDVFVNIRDNLLLTFRPGVGIVNGYYRYTLYPAEVFKRLSDKQLRTCALEGVEDQVVADRLEKVLLLHGYFAVPAGGTKVDLELTGRGKQLLLGHGGKTALMVDRTFFMTSAGDVLGRFSEKTDNNAVFRKATIVSLVGVSPLVIYLTGYAVFCLLPGMLAPIRVSSLLAPLFCFVCGAGLIMYLETPPVSEMNGERAAVAMREGSRQERLAVLRYIHDKRLDIADFPGYPDLFETADAAELYWLISNLGHSRHPGAVRIISGFLEADSPYVVCKAIEAAAARAEKQGYQERRQCRQALLRKMGESDNWYVQFYAYQAVRRLGWTPEKSG